MKSDLFWQPKSVRAGWRFNMIICSLSMESYCNEIKYWDIIWRKFLRKLDVKYFEGKIIWRFQFRFYITLYVLNKLDFITHDFIYIWGDIEMYRYWEKVPYDYRYVKFLSYHPALVTNTLRQVKLVSHCWQPPACCLPAIVFYRKKLGIYWFILSQEQKRTKR